MPKTDFKKVKQNNLAEVRQQLAQQVQENTDIKLLMDINSERFNRIIQTQERLVRIDFDLDAYMNLVVTEMLALTPAAGVVVELVENDEMVYKAATGSLADHIGMRLPIKDSLSGLCVTLKEIVYCKDSEVDSRVNLEACRRVGARSLVVAPLFHQGKCVGVLKILSPTADAFDDSDTQTLQLMAGLIGSALAHQIYMETTKNLLAERTQVVAELKKAQEHLKFLAHYDHLTNLVSRGLFNDLLRSTVLRIQRSKRLIALLYLDMDHFKAINDTFGHQTGDELLISFARRLEKCIRSADTAARLGGDEFVVLLEELQDKENTMIIVNRILEAMRSPFDINNHVIQMSISLGLVFYQGEDSTTEELSRKADIALYQAKNKGRNTYCIYDDTISE